MIDKPIRQTSVIVRLAKANEAAAIATVLKQAFAEFEPLYTPEALAATTPTAEQIQNRWGEGPVWVGLLDDHVVGTVAAKPVEDALYIRSMAITPQARGLGLGKLMLGQVEAFAIAHGLRRLYLSTTPFLLSAIRLYEQFGFRRASDDAPLELFGTVLFTMEKRV